MSQQTLPIIAIVGQPNAGKSTLLNKIAGQRLAVTSNLAGTTRDRQYIDTNWNKADFTLVDTAGLSLDTNGELEHNVAKQIDVAVAEADAIIFVVDGKLPRASIETKTLQKFRKIKKPLLLAINKMDSPKSNPETMAAYEKLGIKPVFSISSVSGRGIGDMLDHVADVVSGIRANSSADKADSIYPSDEQQISVAIVGKPNVGKSSIFNKILNEERMVVSPVPGTTRTAIDSPVTYKDRNYVFIDTAGLKKKEHRQAQADVFSGFQTFKSIRRSDVCFLVIDATEEITKQDQRIAQEIFSQEKGVVILANKFDVFNGDEDKLRDYISYHLPFLWMSPVFFVSGLTGHGLEQALDAILPIYNRRNTTIEDQTLSEFLKKLMKKNPPKLLRDQKNPKVFSLHQYAVNPPSFELMVNHPAAISQQFRKFVENSIIKILNFWGTPIVLRLKGKDKA